MHNPKTLLENSEDYKKVIETFEKEAHNFKIGPGLKMCVSFTLHSLVCIRVIYLLIDYFKSYGWDFYWEYSGPSTIIKVTER